MTVQFQEFPKIPRLNREVVITEKIDGTNACVVVVDEPIYEEVWSWKKFSRIQVAAGTERNVFAQSRNRLLTIENDNAGFAKWVNAHAEELKTLGPGYHYGEWWGLGIGRKYGLKEKKFSLFNSYRWLNHKLKNEPSYIALPGQGFPPECCDVVPIIYQGPLIGNGNWSTDPDPVFVPNDAAHMLTWHGSYAAPGFMDPEGIVVWHDAAKQYFKITCKNDESRKGK